MTILFALSLLYCFKVITVEHIDTCAVTVLCLSTIVLLVEVTSKFTGLDIGKPVSWYYKKINTFLEDIDNIKRNKLDNNVYKEDNIRLSRDLQAANAKLADLVKMNQDLSKIIDDNKSRRVADDRDSSKLGSSEAELERPVSNINKDEIDVNSVQSLI